MVTSKKYLVFFTYENKNLNFNLFTKINYNNQKQFYANSIDYNIKCNFIRSIRIILNYQKFITFLIENDLKIFNYNNSNINMNPFLNEIYNEKIDTLSFGVISLILKQLIKLKHANINRFKFWNTF